MKTQKPQTGDSKYPRRGKQKANRRAPIRVRQSKLTAPLIRRLAFASVIALLSSVPIYTQETPLNVSFEHPNYRVLEGESVDVNVVLTPVPDREVTIPILIQPYIKSGIPAELGDYTVQGLGVGGTLTFLAGDASETFVITAEHDDSEIQMESVVILFGPLPLNVTATPNTDAYLLILDNDVRLEISIREDRDPDILVAQFRPISDPEGDHLTWWIDGPDADFFDFRSHVQPNGHSVGYFFLNKPLIWDHQVRDRYSFFFYFSDSRDERGNDDSRLPDYRGELIILVTPVPQISVHPTSVLAPFETDVLITFSHFQINDSVTIAVDNECKLSGALRLSRPPASISIGDDGTATARVTFTSGDVADSDCEIVAQGSLEFRGAGTGSDTATATVHVTVGPALENVMADPEVITQGEDSTLSWDPREDVESVVVSAGTEDLWTVFTTTATSYLVRPTETTTYTLTALDDEGSELGTFIVEITVPPVGPALENVMADPEVIPQGEDSTLSWDPREDVESVVVSAGTEDLSTVFTTAATSYLVRPTETTTYTLTALDDEGSELGTFIVEITVPPVGPALENVMADPEVIPQGEDSTLSWTPRADIESVIVSDGDKDLATVLTAEGNAYVVRPGETTTYTLTALDDEGSELGTFIVEITVPPVGPALENVMADPEVIPQGEDSTLSWTPRADIESVIVSDGDKDLATVLTAEGNAYVVRPGETTTYTLIAQDDKGVSLGEFTVTVTVVAKPYLQNSAPTVSLSCDPCEVNPGGEVKLSATAADPNGDTLTYSWDAQQGSFSTPTDSASVRWKAPMRIAQITIRVEVNDGHGGSASATVVIEVINQPPSFEQAVFYFELAENLDGSQKAFELGSVSAEDPADKALIYELVTEYFDRFEIHAHDAVLTYVGSGENFEVEPNRFDLEVHVRDTFGAEARTQVVVTVTNVVETPVAVNDEVVTPEDAMVKVDVLANDSDPDGGRLRIESASVASNGNTAITSEAITYTPETNFHGADQFSYVVSNVGGETATATVHVTVLPVNDAPIAIDDNVTMQEDESVTVDVLANDTDPDGDPLYVESVSNGVHGTAVVAGGVVKYTPQANFHGVDWFTYVVSDGHDATATATVNVTVLPVNDAPVGPALENVMADPEVIPQGEDSTLSWDPREDVESVVVSAGTEDLSTVFTTTATSYLVRPTETTTYTLTALDDEGSELGTFIVEITVPPVGPALENVMADPEVIPQGEDSTLSWDPREDVESVVVSAGTEDLSTVFTTTATSYLVRPTETTTYTLTALNDEGSELSTFIVEITVFHPPVGPALENVMADPEVIPQGEDSTLSWDPREDVESVVVSAGTEDLSTVFTTTATSYLVRPTETTTYTLTALDDEGSELSTFIVEITVFHPPVGPALENVMADPEVIPQGEDSTLSWDPREDVESVVVSAGTEDLSTVFTTTATSYLVRPTETTTYTLTALDDEGSELSTFIVEITVFHPPVGPALENVMADPEVIPQGEDSTLSWDPREDVESVVVSAGTEDLSTVFTTTATSYLVRPTETTTYTLTALDDEGSELSTFIVEITVFHPPVGPALENVMADPEVIPQGEDSTLSWTPRADIESVIVSDGDKDLATVLTAEGNAYVVRPGETTTYTLIAQDDKGVSLGEFTVTVTVVAKPYLQNSAPTVSLSCDPCEVNPGGEVKLSATAADPNGDTLTYSWDAQQGSFSTPTDSASVRWKAPMRIAQITIRVEVNDGHGGSASATVVIEVINQPPSFEQAVFYFELAENLDGSQKAFELGSVSAEDPADKALIYELVTEYFDRFEIHAHDAVLTYVGSGENFEVEPNRFDLEVHVRDTFGAEARTQVVVTVTNVVETPVAVNDEVVTPEDAMVKVDVLANDSDPDGGRLRIESASVASNGNTAITSEAITYTPETNFHGADQFSYVVSNVGGETATATVHVTVLPVNDAPIAIDDNVTMQEDESVTVDVLANDTDPDGDPLYVESVSNGVHGTAVVAGGVVKYTPQANFHDVDWFTYVVSDGHDATATATVNVTVLPVNDAPVALDDEIKTLEDVIVTVDVLANDTDPDEDTLYLESVSSGSHGTTAVTGKTVTYLPDANYNGNDRFTYVIADAAGETATATVNVTVLPVNDAPVAHDDETETAEDEIVTIDVLANDTDPDEDTLYLESVSSGSHGTTAVTGKTVTYLPDANYNGNDRFTYVVADGIGETATATVVVSVLPVNDVPIAVDDEVTTREDETVLVDVLANDTDPDGDRLHVETVSNATHGTTAVTNGTVTYTPDANYHGADTFTYVVSDGHDANVTAVVNVTVLPMNDAPIAIDDKVTMQEDESVTVDVLANDTDPDGDHLYVESVSVAVYGTAIVADGVVTYAPPANFHDVDSFTYVVSDGHDATATATVNVTVLPVNDAPMAVDDRVEMLEDKTVLVDVLANDFDLDGDRLVVESASGASYGSTEVSGFGVNYTPNPNYHGADQFTYVISDGGGESATATVDVTVLAVNDAPVQVEAMPNQSLDEGGSSVNVSLDQFFDDPDGDLLIFRASSSDTAVVTVNVIAAVLTLTPVTYGTASVSVVAQDPGGLTITQMFDAGVSDKPVRHVLDNTLAALARSYFASARMTLSRRINTGVGDKTHLTVGGRPVRLGTPTAVTATERIDKKRSIGLARNLEEFPNRLPRVTTVRGGGFDLPILERLSVDTSSGMSDFSAKPHDWLRGTDFVLTLGESDDKIDIGHRPRWQVWGQGDIQTLQGSPTESSAYDGDLRTAYLGIDTRLTKSWLAGVALGRSRGVGDWNVGTARGRLTTTVTALHPYARWSNEVYSVWGMVGGGRGEAENFRSGTGGKKSSALSLLMGLVEARRSLGVARSGTQLALRGDVAWARLATANGAQTVDSQRISVNQVRLGTDMSHSFLYENGLALAPFAEAHLRYDGGAGQDGTGLELAGGLRFVRGIIRVDAQARLLVLHSAKGYRERGAGVSLSIGDQEGLSLSLSPHWGDQTNRTETLWQDHIRRQHIPSSSGNDWTVDARSSYGLRLRNGRLLTCFGEFSQSEISRWIVGVRLGP